MAPPLRFELITGGHSNLTFRVTDAEGRRWVLRRPPLRQVLATAHDMAREHRIIAALADTSVPVPPLVGLCEDTAVNGAPFFVMDFVDGLVLRDVPAGEQIGPDERRAAAESMIDTLAAIHDVDVDAVGLGDLGRREDYLARQLKRWYGQFEKSKLREIPEVDEVHDELVRTMPEQKESTIVHGDFRLDNCLVSPEGRIQAVLDWELCTLGDPLADVGLMIVYTPDAAVGAGPAAPLGHRPARVPEPGRAAGPLRPGVGAGSVVHRVLRRFRILEARLHHRRRLRPLRGRRHGQPGRVVVGLPRRAGGGYGPPGPRLAGRDILTGRSSPGCRRWGPGWGRGAYRGVMVLPRRRSEARDG